MPSVAAKFRRIALIGKLRSPEVEASLGEIRKFLSSRGCEVLKNGVGADLAIVVGGDGTMLAAARELVPAGVPLVGINQGRVGFMTDIGYDDMRAGIGAILEGRYVVEERSLIDAEILRDGKSMLRTVALNEAVVGKGSQGRLIEFELSLDGEFVYALRADGVRALGAGTDSASRRAGARAGAAQPAHALGAAGERQRQMRHRYCARPYPGPRRADLLRRLRARRARARGSSRPEAFRARRALHSSAGLPVLRHPAREARLERDAPQGTR
jgi:hypothetical protein